MKNLEKSKTILVIDDSNTNIVLLEAILAEKGYFTRTAYNAEEARESITKYMPDLILLDLLMPKISGYDFLKELKNNPEVDSIPVIVVSAHLETGNIKRVMDLGATDLIMKPIDIAQLIKKVSKILNSHE
ncbi:MAG: response regulator [Bacteroidota bacterium]